MNKIYVATTLCLLFSVSASTLDDDDDCDSVCMALAYVIGYVLYYIFCGIFLLVGAIFTALAPWPAFQGLYVAIICSVLVYIFVFNSRQWTRGDYKCASAMAAGMGTAAWLD